MKKTILLVAVTALPLIMNCATSRRAKRKTDVSIAPTEAAKESEDAEAASRRRTAEETAAPPVPKTEPPAPQSTPPAIIIRTP